MIREALEYLKEMLDGSQLVELQSDGNGTLFVNSKTGERVFVADMARPIEFEASSIESFVSMVENYQMESPGVYVGPDSVRGLLEPNDGKRADYVDLALAAHPTVAALEKSTPKQQKQFLEFLRIDLFGSVLDVDDLRERCSTVKFETESKAESTVKHGDAAMSTSIAAKVSGVSEMPETVSVTFEPYPAIGDELGNREVTVHCALIVSTENASFHLRPLPGELQAAQNAATKMVVELLREQFVDTPVFAGRS